MRLMAMGVVMVDVPFKTMTMYSRKKECCFYSEIRKRNVCGSDELFIISMYIVLIVLTNLNEVWLFWTKPDEMRKRTGHEKKFNVFHHHHQQSSVL